MGKPLPSYTPVCCDLWGRRAGLNYRRAMQVFAILRLATICMPKMRARVGIAFQICTPGLDLVLGPRHTVAINRILK